MAAAPCQSMSKSTSRPAAIVSSTGERGVPYRCSCTSAHSMKSPAATIASKAFGVRNRYSRPSCSPGRGSRVVADTESTSPPFSAIKRRESDVLPAPDGLETISINPRRDASLDILHLLAQLIDRRLEFEPDGRKRGRGRLRTQRVGLAHELLGQEVEPAADARAFGQQRTRRGDMRAQPVELFANVGPASHDRRFLHDALVELARAIDQFGHPPGEALLQDQRLR